MLRFEIVKPGEAAVTLNRPDSHNSLDAASVRDFVAALDRCESDPAIRLLRVAATGRHFCSGADIRGLAGGESPVPAAPQASLATLLRRLHATPLPTVALVQGACIGGGVGLAACCDVVIAESTAFFSIPEVRLGIPPAGLLPYLVAVMGPRQLRRYALTGERIGAKRACAIGLVHQVCVPGELERAAVPVIADILRGGPAALGATKGFIAGLAPLPMSADREAALESEMAAIIASPEAVEGVAAFVEKRAPSWLRRGGDV